MRDVYQLPMQLDGEPIAVVFPGRVAKERGMNYFTTVLNGKGPTLLMSSDVDSLPIPLDYSSALGRIHEVVPEKTYSVVPQAYMLESSKENTPLVLERALEFDKQHVLTDGTVEGVRKGYRLEHLLKMQQPKVKKLGHGKYVNGKFYEY